jgi:ABC-type thiamin/hydroxymethylpyrimidine transport system permease subunit
MNPRALVFSRIQFAFDDPFPVIHWWVAQPVPSVFPVIGVTVVAGLAMAVVRHDDDIASVMKKVLDFQGPEIVGVHVEYRDNHELFEMLHGIASTDAGFVAEATALAK